VSDASLVTPLVTPASRRFTLRDLPLPAKVVVTSFLLAVGLGYTAALLQLHFQDSKSGQPMPTVEDVVLKFTGKKWFTQAPPPPVSRLVKLLVTPTGPFGGTGTMRPAFFEKDGGEFNRTPEAERPRVRAEREGEIQALVLWAEAAPEVRKAAYEADRFVPPPGQMPPALTREFASEDGQAVRVKAILDARCVRCHGKGEAQESYPLETYAQIEKYLSVPATVSVPPGGGWVRVEEPISLEKLTQSTHAHLLSFAVLFSLTGLVFAFTSYPTFLRCLLGPAVLVAIVTDVCFWWLARLSEGYGHYFAMGVMGTGGAAGLGLALQITLSLWNMYGPRGKVVIVGLLALAAATGGLVITQVAWPGLEAKRAELEKAKADADNPKADADNPKADGQKKPEPPPQPHAKPEDKKDTKPEDKKTEEKKTEDKKAPPPAAPSELEKVLTIPAGADPRGLKWKGDIEGGMVLAFFDRDEGKAFLKALKDADEDGKKRLLAERNGELAAMLAWVRSSDADRRRAYETDLFDLPPSLLGKPVTPDYKAGDRAVKIRSLITDRCTRCHQEGGDREETPLDSYDNIKKKLEPRPKPVKTVGATAARRHVTAVLPALPPGPSRPYPSREPFQEPFLTTRRLEYWALRGEPG